MRDSSGKTFARFDYDAYGAIRTTQVFATTLISQALAQTITDTVDPTAMLLRQIPKSYNTSVYVTMDNTNINVGVNIKLDWWLNTSFSIPIADRNDLLYLTQNPITGSK